MSDVGLEGGVICRGLCTLMWVVARVFVFAFWGAFW